MVRDEARPSLPTLRIRLRLLRVPADSHNEAVLLLGDNAGACGRRRAIRGDDAGGTDTGDGLAPLRLLRLRDGQLGLGATLEAAEAEAGRLGQLRRVAAILRHAAAFVPALWRPSCCAALPRAACGPFKLAFRVFQLVSGAAAAMAEAAGASFHAGRNCAGSWVVGPRTVKELQRRLIKVSQSS